MNEGWWNVGVEDLVGCVCLSARQSFGGVSLVRGWLIEKVARARKDRGLKRGVTWQRGRGERWKEEQEITKRKKRKKKLKKVSDEDKGRYSAHSSVLWKLGLSSPSSLPDVSNLHLRQESANTKGSTL